MSMFWNMNWKWNLRHSSSQTEPTAPFFGGGRGAGRERGLRLPSDLKSNRNIWTTDFTTAGNFNFFKNYETAAGANQLWAPEWRMLWVLESCSILELFCLMKIYMLQCLRSAHTYRAISGNITIPFRTHKKNRPGDFFYSSYTNTNVHRKVRRILFIMYNSHRTSVLYIIWRRIF